MNEPSLHRKIQDLAFHEVRAFEQAVIENIGNRITNEMCTGLVLRGERMLKAVVDSVPQPPGVPGVSVTTEKQQIDQANELAHLLRGDEAAISLFNKVSNLSHVYDDLVDKDNEVDIGDLHEAMADALFHINENEIYKQNAAQISTILKMGLLNWRAANAMEATGLEEEIRIAHVLRFSAGDILLFLMAAVNPNEVLTDDELRRARLLIQPETWAEYRSEHVKD